MISMASLKFEYRLLFTVLTVSSRHPYLPTIRLTKMVPKQVSLAILSFGGYFTLCYLFSTDKEA